MKKNNICLIIQSVFSFIFTMTLLCHPGLATIQSYYENKLTKNDISWTSSQTIHNDDHGYFSTPIKQTTRSVKFYGDTFTIDGIQMSRGDEIGVFDPDGT